jgi:ligand-binding SRPBCC domain-containing protein
MVIEDNMLDFDYTFTVRAPLSRVSAFHHDTSALRQLTPPPIFVQMHDIEPLGEGSRSEFTLWFGPLPVRWVAVHSNVGEQGFTDRQASGPMRHWEHTHRFTAGEDGVTQISEHVEYEHHPGWRGLLSRLLFSRPALWLLFSYRKFATRRAVRANRSSG